MTTTTMTVSGAGVAEAVEAVVAKGNLAALSPAERVNYYQQTCASLGLNPLTKPFEYITLNNKLTLYATRTAADQLRKRDGVNIEIVSREQVGDLYVVVARATDREGRFDEEIGAVSTKGLAGENLANAMMKALTKAKRRVTLSICGLGWLDETEVDSIPHARPGFVDAETGEIVAKAEAARPDWQPELARLLKDAGLTMADLSPVVGVALTKANYAEAIGYWLDVQEATVYDLVGMVLEVKAASVEREAELVGAE